MKKLIHTVNPHYGNPFFPQSGTNCGSCAIAVYNRLNGDKTATAKLTDPCNTSDIEKATGKKCQIMSTSDIESKVKSMGKGGHMIVAISRKHPVTGKPMTGHAFNVFYDGDKVYTVDGQTDDIHPWPYDYGNVDKWMGFI